MSSRQQAHSTGSNSTSTWEGAPVSERFTNDKTWLAHLQSLRESILNGTFPTHMTPLEIITLYQPSDYDRLFWYEGEDESLEFYESDEQVWLRKAKESKTGERRHRMPFPAPSGTPENRRPTKESPGFLYHPGGPAIYPNDQYSSLYEDVTLNGIKGIVSLCGNLDSVGSSGKPEVLGGTHRLAVMLVENPDQPVRVRFFKDMREAKLTLDSDY